MSSQFWLDVCNSSLSRPVEDQLKIAAASCGVTVAVFCLAAAVSGTMFLRWRRIDVNARRPLWKFYGWFCALSFLGNCFGIAVWVIWWKVLSLYFVVGDLQSMQRLDAELLWLTARLGVRLSSSCFSFAALALSKACSCRICLSNCLRKNKSPETSSCCCLNL